MRPSIRHAFVPALLLLGACTVGPDYAGPPSVLPPPPAGSTGGYVRGDETTLAQQPRLAQWWTALGDPVLDELEQKALSGSPDLAVAQARFDQARAAMRISRADGQPQLGAIGTVAHVRIPDVGESAPPSSAGEAASGGTTSTNFYNLGLNASWEIDLFGGQRRNNEAADAELLGAEAAVADAQVSLTAAVAQAYLEYRDRQQRIAQAEEAVTQRAALAEFARQRLERGSGTRSEMEQAQKALEATRQQILPLRAEAAGFANALAILTGQVPGAVDALLVENAAIPLPPASVAVGDPAALLMRRPDIRMAERQLAAETARIGVAEAERFPRLSFLGILGVGGTRPADLTHLDDFTAIAAPMLQWNFLDFGRGKARVGQAEAKRDEAEAAYRRTVLGALRDVEDALASFRAARESVASLARAEMSAAKIEELARQRFDLGAAGKADWLDAQLAHNDTQQALIRARAGLTIRFVALQKALGLGWT